MTNNFTCESCGSELDPTSYGCEVCNLVETLTGCLDAQVLEVLGNLENSEEVLELN